MMFMRRQNKLKECQDISPVDADGYQSKNPASKEQPWLPDLGLSKRDQRTLLSPTAWLTDDIINVAQKLLKAQSPALSGFQNVGCGLTMNFSVETEEFVQIIHTGEGQWVTISTIGTVHPEVVVYDSIYTTLPMLAKAQIASLLATQQPTIRVKFMDVQMQSGSSDCGLFAIAYATALSFGLPPGMFQFEQPKMHSHLQTCLEEGRMTMFLIRRTRRSANRVKSTDEFNVYCTCRMPDLPDTHWIQCSQCREWYHVPLCVRVPKQALDPQVAWCFNSCKC